MRRLLVPLLLLGAIVPFGASAYVDRLRLAMSLRHMTMEQRKEVLFAPWYAEAAALARATPPNAKIDFVMTTPQARDIAVLAGAVLQPRDVRFFDGWAAWTARRRAEFLHDTRAANAAPAPPPGRAAVVIAVDPTATPRFRVVR